MICTRSLYLSLTDRCSLSPPNAGHSWDNLFMASNNVDISTKYIYQKLCTSALSRGDKIRNTTLRCLLVCGIEEIGMVGGLWWEKISSKTLQLLWPSVITHLWSLTSSVSPDTLQFGAMDDQTNDRYSPATNVQTDPAPESQTQRESDR